MRVAIISDIHDHLFKLDQALAAIRRTGATTLICCGDLCSPFVIHRLATGFAGRVHIVFGNNDGDRYRLAENARGYRRMTLHGEMAELRLARRSFAVQHFDDIGRAIAQADAYDVVCFGHNHRWEIAHVGKTLLINPGAIMGEVPRPRQASFVLYDTADGGTVTFVSKIADRSFRRLRV